MTSAVAALHESLYAGVSYIFAYSIPSRPAVDAILAFSDRGIVEICAGRGY
jgi:hypothetical protein